MTVTLERSWMVIQSCCTSAINAYKLPRYWMGRECVRTAANDGDDRGLCPLNILKLYVSVDLGKGDPAADDLHGERGIQSRHIAVLPPLCVRNAREDFDVRSVLMHEHVSRERRQHLIGQPLAAAISPLCRGRKNLYNELRVEQGRHPLDDLILSLIAYGGKIGIVVF